MIDAFDLDDFAESSLRHVMTLSGIVCVLVVAAAIGEPSPAPPSSSPVPAFPGAEGAGAFTKGGRGGRVLAVTTLADYLPGREAIIPGSLRSVIDAKGPRIVVFRVSGNIDLKDELVVREPFLTIAGQTAPGDGVCLRGSSLVIDAPEVVVRYLRVRPGDIQQRELDSISCSAHQVILDHCSASWGIDETISTNGDSANVTVQWCMITESLNHSVHHKGSHGYGSLISGPGEITYHHNVYAYHRSRSPRPGDVLLDFRNNLIFGWGDRAGYSGDENLQMNYIGNFLRPLEYSKRADVAFSPGGLSERLYVEGNVLAGTEARTKNNWLLIRPPDGVEASLAERTLRVSHAFPTSHVTTESAEQAYERILENAGATRPVRDAVDKRVMHQIQTGKGTLIDSQADVGGWPDLAPGEPPPDSDQDGMADAWETRHQLDSQNASDGAEDADGDGYTNVEEYLNDTDPRQAEKWIAPTMVTSSRGPFFTGTTTIDMACSTPGAQIRYTLDESLPTRSSPLYSQPFELTASKMIRAVAFHADQASYVTNAPMSHLPFHEPITIEHPAPGLAYDYGETMTNDKRRLGDPFTVKTRGVTQEISAGVRERDDCFALRFAGYFSAPQDGIYTFYLCCSSRGRLYFGKTLVVENEGRKCEHQGSVALRRGFHPLEFQINYPSDENKTLQVSVAGPQMPRQPLGTGILFHRRAP